MRPTAHPDAIGLAQALLTERTALAGNVLGPAILPALRHEASNLEAARDLLALASPGRPMDLRSAVALAERATRWQAEALGVAWSEAALPRHAAPGDGLLELAVRHGAVPSAEQVAGLARLDALEEPVRGALLRVVDAFLAFDEASRKAYAKADLALPGATSPADLGIDLTWVLPARLALLEAALELSDALAQHPVAAAYSPTVALPPIFSIDLDTSSDTYTAADPFVLLVDAGGSDSYLNNAGGNNLGSLDPCQGPLTTPVLNVPAAALVDLDVGADQYGSASSPRGCGANGGGARGSGFLLDAGGTNGFVAGDGATNGGAQLGTGFLLNAGDGAFTAGGIGTNGGASTGGLGLLLTAGSGPTAYTVTQRGANGGGNGGLGFLLDAGGDDTYTAEGTGTNGGGATGTGFLLDAAGNDTYAATVRGANGGGTAQGRGFLLDAAGDDAYGALHASDLTGGTNGGAVTAVGMLVDGGGDDAYDTSGIAGTNGGAATGGVGFLYDDGGNDSYHSTFATSGINGGGALGVGLLFDRRGFDLYFDPGVGPCSNTAGPTNCAIVPKDDAGALVDGTCRLVLAPTVCSAFGE